MRLHPADGPSNQPLLDALRERRSLTGHVLVRSDGSIVPVELAKLADWQDIRGQLDGEVNPADALLN
jgi:hypothetical protein